MKEQEWQSVYIDEHVFYEGENISFSLYEEDNHVNLIIHNLDEIISDRIFTKHIEINNRDVCFNITGINDEDIPDNHAYLKFNKGLKQEISLNLQEDSLVIIYPENNFLWKYELIEALNDILFGLNFDMKKAKAIKLAQDKLIKRGLK